MCKTQCHPFANYQSSLNLSILICTTCCASGTHCKSKTTLISTETKFLHPLLVHHVRLHKSLEFCKQTFYLSCIFILWSILKSASGTWCHSQLRGIQPRGESWKLWTRRRHRIFPLSRDWKWLLPKYGAKH